jgi:hypothetical protein
MCTSTIDDLYHTKETIDIMNCMLFLDSEFAAHGSIQQH